MAQGGTVESISIDGRRFVVDGEADVNLKIGGYKNDVKPNGDGSVRLLKTPFPGTIDSAPVQIDTDNSDFEFLQEKANGSSFFDVDVTLVDGKVYSGKMQLVDEIKYSTKEATAEISLAGKLLEKQ